MNTLIVYYYHQYPPRATHIDNLYSFERYGDDRYFYLNTLMPIPWYVRQFPWDLVIIHDLFLSTRWSRGLFAKQVEKLSFLKDCKAAKVVIPQDEFLSMDLVCKLINDWGISHVFSVAPESEWHRIYRNIDVKLHKVLTGYVDERLVEKIKGWSEERTIDIGYRTHKTPLWLGRHGLIKERIGEVVKEAAKGLVTDISTRSEDTILGDGWYKFLLKCKYQLGVEGGASILDWDGSYFQKTAKYVGSHPAAGFEEVEKACFPSAEGSLRLFALSPRNLECCMTKTCQILVEGNYDGVLEPWKHYIPLKSDFSNLDEVLRIVKEDKLRQEITDRAYDDIVVKGAYTYKKFVDQVRDDGPRHLHTPRPSRNKRWFVYWLMKCQDVFTWKVVIPCAHHILTQRVQGLIKRVLYS